MSLYPFFLIVIAVLNYVFVTRLAIRHNLLQAMTIVSHYTITTIFRKSMYLTLRAFLSLSKSLVKERDFSGGMRRKEGKKHRSAQDRQSM